LGYLGDTDSLGSQRKQVVRVLVKALRDEDEFPIVRCRTAGVLGRVDPEGKQAIPILLEIIRDKKQNKYVRVGAVQGLAAIDPAAKEAVPILKKMLQHKNKKIRKLAAQALKKIENEEPVVEEEHINQ
ncbi:unnamed protein product, partial [marine sediment metagenome]